jgi:cell division protein FtsB
MNLRKLKIGAVGAIAVAGAMASLVIQHRAEVKIREKDEAWRQQDNQLVALAPEHERVSNVVTQVKSSPPDEQQRELQKLRIEVERLRKQINELESKLEPVRQARIALFASTHPTPEYREQREAMAVGKIKDASSLYAAIEHYLANHQDQFPSNLNQLAPHLQKEHLPLTGTNEFEIVYTGTSDRFTNIPVQGVAVFRERQAWLAPSGKWARLYVTADGYRHIVESDDNFQAWEAEHIFPPPAAGQ